MVETQKEEMLVQINQIRRQQNLASRASGIFYFI